MKTADTHDSSGNSKSKIRLSPDLVEMLHMLKSLETGVGEETSPAR